MPTKAWPGQSEHCMLGSPLLKSKTDRLTDVSQPYSTPNELGMPPEGLSRGARVHHAALLEAWHVSQRSDERYQRFY